MLVITRKTDEGFKIGDDIEVKILEISKDRVKLGITAPKDINIARNELIEAKQANWESSKNITKDAFEHLLKFSAQKGEDND